MIRKGMRVSTPYGEGTVTEKHSCRNEWWVALDAQRDVPVTPDKITILKA